MPLSTAPVQSIYPGSTGTLFGTETLYGSPIVEGPEAIADGDVSRTVVVAARPGDHPSTQRQIVWTVKYATSGAGSPSWELWGSADGENFVKIDTNTSSSSGPRMVQADATTGALTAAVSSCRFFYVKNASASGQTAQVKISCQ